MASATRLTCEQLLRHTIRPARFFKRLCLILRSRKDGPVGPSCVDCSLGPTVHVGLQPRSWATVCSQRQGTSMKPCSVEIRRPPSLGVIM